MQRFDYVVDCVADYGRIDDIHARMDFRSIRLSFHRISTRMQYIRIEFYIDRHRGRSIFPDRSTARGARDVSQSLRRDLPFLVDGRRAVVAHDRVHEDRHVRGRVRRILRGALAESTRSTDLRRFGAARSVRPARRVLVDVLRDDQQSIGRSDQDAEIAADHVARRRATLDPTKEKDQRHDGRHGVDVRVLVAPVEFPELIARSSIRLVLVGHREFQFGVRLFPLGRHGVDRLQSDHLQFLQRTVPQGGATGDFWWQGQLDEGTVEYADWHHGQNDSEVVISIDWSGYRSIDVADRFDCLIV